MSGAARVHGRLESRAGAVLAAELVGFRGGPVATVAMVAIAWATLLALDATGAAAALHHHALIEGGPPLMVAVPLFLLAWQFMIAAMMVPASMPAIRNVIGVASGT